MPIRTDRGRAAALRQFWSWPLRSAHHMAATGLIVVLLVTGIALAAAALQTPEPHSDAASGPAAATNTTDPSGPTTRETTTADSDTEPASSSTSPSPSNTPPQEGTATSGSPAGAVSDGTTGAVTTAVGFIQHWLRPPPGTPDQQWVRRLQPYVLPGAAGGVRSINPDTVPATAITGEPELVRSEQGIAVVEVPIDAGRVRVTVLAYPATGEWLVKTWAPVDR